VEKPDLTESQYGWHEPYEPEKQCFFIHDQNMYSKDELNQYKSIKTKAKKCDRLQI